MALLEAKGKYMRDMFSFWVSEASVYLAECHIDFHILCLGIIHLAHT